MSAAAAAICCPDDAAAAGPVTQLASSAPPPLVLLQGDSVKKQLDMKLQGIYSRLRPSGPFSTLLPITLSFFLVSAEKYGKVLGIET